jgi:4-amino-4-deoxy-L-arabinose transferase-like glycosyltransferase
MVTAAAPATRATELERLFAAAARAAPVLVAGLVIANGWAGLMPGLGFWDTGEFQTVLPIMGTAHPTGYPTYVLLGFVFNILLTPLGEPAFRITALSLVAIATAVGLTVVLVRRLTGSTVLGVAAGVGLALTPVVWVNATRADPHPIHLAFVTLLLVLLVTWSQRQRAGEPRTDRWLVASAAVFGLSMGNHSLTLLLAIPVALFVVATDPRVVRRGRLVLTCALVLVATVTLVYLELPLRAGLLRAPLVYAHPETWDGFWYIALAEQFRGSLSNPLGHLGDKMGTVLDLAWTQFGLLSILILPGFLAAIRTVPRYALLTGSAMIVTLLFNTSYANADIERYYLGPVLWAWTWIAIFAAFVVRQVAFAVDPASIEPGEEPDISLGRATHGRAGRGLAPAAVAVLVAAALLVLPGIESSPGTRASADRSHDTAARTWLDQTLAAVAPNAVIVSWWTTSTPLWYGQDVLSERPDIFVVDDRTMLDQDLGGANDVIARYLGSRPVYVVRASPRDLGLVTARFAIQPVTAPDGQPIGGGSTALYEVIGRTPG